jgi:hypothetical protein
MGLKIPNMFGKSYRTIPHELPSGQTAMFKPGAEATGGKMPGVIGRGLGGRVTNKPPFKAQGYGSGDPRAKVMGKARSEELSQKAKVARLRKSKDTGKKHGPMTEVDYVDSLFGIRK